MKTESELLTDDVKGDLNSLVATGVVEGLGSLRYFHNILGCLEDRLMIFYCLYLKVKNMCSIGSFKIIAVFHKIVTVKYFLLL